MSKNKKTPKKGNDSRSYVSPFERPQDTTWNIISLGGGVQSSAMALMAAAGEITPMPQAAIFADTQAEPKEVYSWIDWLETQLPFPVYRVTKGSLAEKELSLQVSQKSGKRYKSSKIPAFARKPDGGVGLLGRKCTADFKITPITQRVRELCGITRGQKTLSVTQWIGISYDEMARASASQHPWCQMRFPLLETGATREDCLAWMTKHGHPRPPRSACLFCPFHNDAEWQRIRSGDPDEWAYVQQFERDLQKAAAQCEVMHSVPFLHPSCIPIADVVLKPKAPKEGDKQLTMHELWNDIKNDCSGMCGV
jgi:hypothetical protein